MPTYNPTDSRYLAVAQTRTRNGQTDIKIILDLDTNEFYTLDDDGNFNLIGGGGGSQTLEQVLTQGASTGNISILSPDNQSALSVVDGNATLEVGDGVNTNNYIQLLPAKIGYVSIDLNNNDNTTIEQHATSLLLANNSTGVGAIVNSLLLTQNEVVLEHNNSGLQRQQIYVDADSCNMVYDDGINIIDVELGLTNGFRARQTNTTPDFENFIQVKFDYVNLVYNDIPGGINHELRVDADGYFLKNLSAYQDDAAAQAAGLPQGYLYQTDGTGAAPLDVAGIIMIKQ